jgi:predicted GNAT superfamily acetyltransferase
MTAAWDLAHRAAQAAAVTLRPLTGDADVEAINHVVASTWGGQYLEREVVRALCVSGNVPWGAEAGGTVIGFVLGWAGVDEGGLHVHSHMLASVPDRRHAGVGYALKLAQRAQALDQGIVIMRWTFDPMVARNAWFNLGKLGVVVDRFERSFYGEMQDAINAGDRSDRFTVRWDLPREPGPRPIPGEHVTVPIPPEYHELRVVEPVEASRQRDDAARSFEESLGAGLVCVAFDRATSAYVFAHPEGMP